MTKKELKAKLKPEKTLVNNLNWGLWNSYRTFWMNLKHFPHDVKVFFYRIHFLLKHGYSEPAIWETDAWFICWMKDVLKHYRYNRDGTPTVLEDLPDTEEGWNKNEEEYNKIVDRMLELLEIMGDSDTEIYDYKKAKEEFFAIFCKRFTMFWS